jgi:uncharacterized protein (DUF433 family)
MKPEEIVKGYPEIYPEDIKAALFYATRLTHIFL